MRARVRQFWSANTGPADADIELAKEHLSTALFDLFAGQEPRDMRHAVHAAKWLIERGHTDETLIQAALLHDVGKGHQRRWDRVAYVVAGWLGVERSLASRTSRIGLRRAVDRSLRHSSTGAEMLNQAGAPERVVELTRLHHVARPRDAMLKLLNEADAAS